MDRKELRKQVTQSSHTEAEDDIRKAWQKFAAIILVIFAILMVILSVVLIIRGTAEVDEPTVVQEIPPLSLGEFSLRAAEVTRAFLEADTVLDKANQVMEPRRVMPLMEDYYSKVPMEDKKLLELSGEKFHVAEERDFLLADVIFEDNSRASWVFEANDEGKVKIQWEVAVGYSDKDWERFIETRDSETGNFRVLMEFMVTNPYFNYDFEDSETHSCFMIRHPLSDKFVYGYLETVSDAHKTFNAVRIISNLRSLPVIAKLRFLENGQPDQVLIEDIETFSWISGIDM